jgi:hypothetical protein
VSCNRCFECATAEVEDLERSIVGGRDKFVIMGSERKIPNWIIMGFLDCEHIVYIRLPISNVSILVGGNQPVLIV